jgi:hypothetical protein
VHVSGDAGHNRDVKRTEFARRTCAPLVALAVLVVIAPAAPAADPDSGTVGPGVGSVSYNGAEISATPPALTRRACVDGANCDTYTLTVDVPENLYASQDRVLKVMISWEDADNDLDLYVCSGSEADDPQCLNGLVASSISAGTTSETVTVANPAAGTYRLIAAAAEGTSDYAGSVAFDAPPSVPGARSSSGDFTWNAHAVSAASPYGEPSVDVDHAGRVFVVAPGGSGVQMYRSFDGGFTFDHKEVASDGGGGDSEIEFLLNDTAFTADLRITDSAVSRSTNHFDSFTQQGVGIEQDRQWLAHQCDRTVYLGYHDFVLEAELLNRSDDGGKTWDDQPTFISPPGDSPGSQDAQIAADQGGNTYSGPVVVDQKTGDVYIVFAISSVQGNATTGTPPYGEPEQIVVGYSHDKGKTFALSYVEKGGAGALAGNIFPWISIDRAGVVYVAWSGRETDEDPINIFYSYSTDHAKTWNDKHTVNTDVTGHAHIYASISAGAPGVADVAWYTSSTPDVDSADNDWFVDFAQVRNAASSSPVIAQSRVYPESIHHGDICLQGILCTAGGDRSLLDFFQVQIGPDGAAHIAFSNNATPDSELRVWYARQVAGPPAGNGLHDTDWCEKSASTAGGTDEGGGDTSVLGTRVLANTGDNPWPYIVGAVLLSLAFIVRRLLVATSLRTLDPGLHAPWSAKR